MGGRGVCECGRRREGREGLSVHSGGGENVVVVTVGEPVSVGGEGVWEGRECGRMGGW